MSEAKTLYMALTSCGAEIEAGWVGMNTPIITITKDGAAIGFGLIGARELAAAIDSALRELEVHADQVRKEGMTG
jgi:hypothetical protein